VQCKESNDNVFSPRLLSNYGQNIRTPGSPRTPRTSSARDSGTPKKFTINLNQVQARSVKHVRLDHHSDLEKIYRIHQEPIGKGSYGTVYRAETRTRLTSASSHHSNSSEPAQSWAIKKIQKSEAGKTERFKLLEREVNILKKVTHKNIIHLEAVYETSDHMYLVTELCIEGELKEYLKKHVKLNESETRTIIKQLSDSLMYLHQYGVVHRDIKLENILVKTEKPVRNSSLSSNSSSTSMESLTSNGTSFLSRKHTSLLPRNKLYSTPDEETITPSAKRDCTEIEIKLTDFGLSVVRGGVTGESMLMTFCGTPVYMAPEVIQNHDYSQTCDIWSMGVIAYTLLSGKYPWIANQEQDLYKKIKKGIPKQDYDKKIFSAQAIDCISRMLEVNTAKRLTAAEVFNHPWTNGKQEMAPPNLFDVLKADAAKVRKEQLNLTPK